MLKLLSIFLFSLHFWMTRKLWKFYGKCPCSVKISAQINNENGVNNHECSTALLVHGNSISLSLSFSRSVPRKFPPVSTLISPSSFSFLRHLHISRERGKKKGHSRRSFSILLCLFLAIYFSAINSFRDASCDWQPSSCYLAHTTFLIYKNPATCVTRNVLVLPKMFHVKRLRRNIKKKY